MDKFPHPKVDALQNRNRDLNKESLVLKAQVDGLIASNHLLASTLNTKQQQVVIFNNAVHQLTSDLKTKQQQVDVLQSINRDLIKESAATKAQVVTLGSENLDAKSALNSVKEDVDALHNSSEDLALQLKAANEKVKRLQQENESLTRQLDESKLQVACGKCPPQVNVDPKVRVKDESGWTPLHRAAYNGTVDEVLALLQKGANPNAKNNDGWSPLHWATIVNSNVEVTRLLLQKGADPNAKSKHGWTPLSLTSNTAKISVLRDYGARSRQVDPKIHPMRFQQVNSIRKSF